MEKVGQAVMEVICMKWSEVGLYISGWEKPALTTALFPQYLVMKSESFLVPVKTSGSHEYLGKQEQGHGFSHWCLGLWNSVWVSVFLVYK